MKVIEIKPVLQKLNFAVVAYEDFEAEVNLAGHFIRTKSSTDAESFFKYQLSIYLHDQLPDSLYPRSTTVSINIDNLIAQTVEHFDVTGLIKPIVEACYVELDPANRRLCYQKASYPDYTDCFELIMPGLIHDLVNVVDSVVR